MAITARTRNPLGALAPRGFESHPLRQYFSSESMVARFVQITATHKTNASKLSIIALQLSPEIFLFDCADLK